MLIVCPKCFAQYAVSDEISIKKGQKFHCSACQNYFILPQADTYNSTDENEEIPTVSAVMQAASQPETALMGSSVTPVADTVKSTPAPAVNYVAPSTNTPSPSVAKEVYIDTIQAPDSEPHFAEPLSLLSNEAPHPADRLDSIPEEFKPVPQPKKASFASTLFWLLVAAAICAGAYTQKDNILHEIDSFILTYLDKKPAVAPEKEVKKQPVSTQSAVKTHPQEQKALTPQNEPKPQPTKSAEQVKETVSAAQPEPVVIKDETVSETQTAPEIAVKSEVTTVVAEQVVNTDNIKVEQPAEKNTIVPETEPAVEQVPTELSVPEHNVPEKLVSAEGVPSVENQVPDTPQDSALSADVTIPTQPNTPIVEANSVPANEAELPVLNGALTDLPPLTQEVAEPTPEPSEQIIRDQARVPDSFAALAETGTIPAGEIANILKIREISYAIEPNEAGMMRLMIKGEIANTELKTVVIPEVKAVVYNAEDMVVARKRIILSQPQIEGNSVQPFFSSVVPAPSQVSRVEVVFDE